jgi:hypothetical protein
MQLRYPIQIQSMIKAMTDVVLPALDPDNKLAQEQSRLIIGMLTLMASQLPLQFRFDCDELQRLTGFARELRQLAQGSTATRAAMAELVSNSSTAAEVLDRAKADPGELINSIRGLRTAIAAVITSVSQDGDPSAIAKVQKAVLARSKEQLLRDRSWLLMQGWETDAASVPRIETLIPTVGAAVHARP